MFASLGPVVAVDLPPFGRSETRVDTRTPEVVGDFGACMKTAKALLQAYIDSSALESAALFADKGALELPYLADLGVEPRYEGPKNIGAFLSFLHEKMCPNFKFVDVKIYIDTSEQAFGEGTIHQKSGISGKDVHQRFFGHCAIANGKIGGVLKTGVS
jgi:hypothetical protein